MYYLHAQNTTALQPNVFLIGIHRILVTNNGRSAFLSATHCQGQLHTPQSVTVAAAAMAKLLIGSFRKGQGHYASSRKHVLFSMFHRAFFNSMIDKHQHMHFFTFKTVLV